jgi:hypothetical protein
MTDSHPQPLPARVQEAVESIRRELCTLRTSTTAQARERATARIVGELDELEKLVESQTSGSSPPGWVDPVLRTLWAEVLKAILSHLPCAQRLLHATARGDTRHVARRFHQRAAGERRALAA